MRDTFFDLDENTKKEIKQHKKKLKSYQKTLILESSNHLVERNIEI